MAEDETAVGCGVPRRALSRALPRQHPLQNCPKEVGPLTAKLALSLINFMKYGIVQFLIYESKLCIFAKHSLTIYLLEQ